MDQVYPAMFEQDFHRDIETARRLVYLETLEKQGACRNKTVLHSPLINCKTPIQHQSHISSYFTPRPVPQGRED